MWRVVGHRSSLVVWGTQRGTSFAEVYTLEEESSVGGWKFRKEEQCSLVCSSSSVVVDANVVFDSDRGQRFPFLLVRKTGHGNQALRLFRLDPYRHVFTSEYVCDAEVDDAHVLAVCPGPSVVARWNRSDRVVVLFPRRRKTCLHLELPSSEVAESLPGVVGRLVTDEVWAFEWLATVPTTTSHVWTRLLMLVRYASGKDTEEGIAISSFFGCCFLCRTEETLVHSRVGVRQFFPPEYASVVKCIAVYWKVEICSTTGMLSRKPLFALGTRYKQVLLFQEGCVLHCVTMTSCPCVLQMLQPPTGETVVACVDKAKAMSVIKMGEIVERREGVEAIVVSDLLTKGQRQLLVCYDKGFVKFRITNLCDIDFRSSCEEGALSDKSCPDSLLSVLKALEIRKHQGELQLENTKKDLYRKWELVQKGVTVLKSFTKQPVTQNEKIPSNLLDTSLVCLLPGNLESQDLHVEQKDIIEHGCVRVLCWWQKVLPNSQFWVMAVLMKNDSSFGLRDLVLSLVPLDRSQPTFDRTGCPCQVQLLETVSCSRIVWTGKGPGSDASKPPPLKKSKKTATNSLAMDDSGLVSPRGSACVTLSMNIPRFTSKSSVEFGVVATWEWQAVDGLKTAEIFRFTLDVNDLFSEQFQCSYDCLNMWEGERRLSSLVTLSPPVPASHQDLACILGGLQLAKLQVQSSHINLNRLPAIVRSILPTSVLVFSQVGKIPLPSTSSQNLATSAEKFHGAPILSGVAIRCLVCNDQRAVLSMLYHCPSQLSIVTQLLKSSIPEGIVITN